jgi:hypothetical protein
MTTQPEVPRGGNDPDTGDRPMPPYDDRRTSADVDPQEKSQRQGAKVGGATGPVEDDELKAAPKEDTPRGAEASPSDEQPASESADTDLDPDMVGPDHYQGTPRGEDEGA